MERKSCSASKFTGQVKFFTSIRDDKKNLTEANLTVKKKSEWFRRKRVMFLHEAIVLLLVEWALNGRVVGTKRCYTTSLATS